MKRVGCYKLLNEIGKGSFSTVFLGYNIAHERHYAVKMCEKRSFEQNGMCVDLDREVDVLQTLRDKSPYIANLIEVMQTDRYYYLVLDLGHTTLYELIRNDPLKHLREDTARQYFQELLLGLYCCHWNGIIHRDIKCENILVTDSGHIKITDFGFAVTANGSCQGGKGTLAYFAPECFDDSAQQRDGFAVDIWAAGVVLYCMASGKLPFFSNADSEQIRMQKMREKILSGRYAMPQHFSSELSAALSCILNTDPTRRPTIIEITNYEWVSKGFDRSHLESIMQTPPPLYPDAHYSKHFSLVQSYFSVGSNSTHSSTMYTGMYH